MRTLAILFLALSLGMLGCRRSGESSNTGGEAQAHGAEGDHEHEIKTVQISVWTNGYEVFAEHQPPIAGQGTRFITHVSELETGKPRTSGPVKFILHKGESSFEHPQAAPARPGIYLPSITFPAEGDWQASLIIAGETNATVDLGIIKVFANVDVAAHAEFPDPPEGVSFLKEQQWRILARTEEATKRTLVERIALHATLVPGPQSKATVSSPVAGRLLANEVVQLGAAVKAGDMLGWIEPAFNEFTAKMVEGEAEALRAKVALDQAKTAFERTQSLFAQNAKSQRELQEAEVAYRSAQAAFDSANTIQQLYRATGATFQNGSLRIALKAPFQGIVDKIAFSVGQRIEPDQPLFTIVNSASALIQAHVPESRVTRVKPEVGAMFQVTSESGPVTITNGLEFVAMAREIDPQTRTLLLTYRLNNPDQTFPIGMAGTLLVPTGKSTDALAIPSRAIVEEEGLPIAFVQVSGETFQKRDLKIGVQDENWSEILSGINERERVMTDGAYALLLSTKSGAIPAHGHAH